MLQVLAYNFIKEEALTQVFCEIFKSAFFTEHLQTTAYVYYKHKAADKVKWRYSV